MQQLGIYYTYKLIHTHYFVCVSQLTEGYSGHGRSQDFFGGSLFKNFQKIFLRKLRKCIIQAYFSKKFNKPCFTFFTRLDEKHNLLEILRKFFKIFDENSIEKLNFYFIFILENSLLKIEPSEITIFLQRFFRFRGGGSPFPPLATPLLQAILIRKPSVLSPPNKISKILAKTFGENND